MSKELGGNFTSQQVVFHVDKHLFLEEISCTEGNKKFHTMIFPVQEEIPFTERNLPIQILFAGRNLLSFSIENQ